MNGPEDRILHYIHNLTFVAFFKHYMHTHYTYCPTLDFFITHMHTLRYVTYTYTSRRVTLRYVTLRYVTLRYVTLRYVTLRYVTLRYVSDVMLVDVDVDVDVT